MDVRLSSLLTAKQNEALKGIATHKYTLMAGGSRSGKTFLACAALGVLAMSKKCRQVALRLHFNDIKQAVGMDTLPKALEVLGMKSDYTINKSDWVFTFNNGSEIWLAGLDDKERSEKILGKEFTTIYFNEASQISYQSYQMALTRLAENSGIPNRVIVDCNPPTKDHWLYALFKMGKTPENRNISIVNPEKYTCINVNPADNVEHLPEGYIEETLSNLSERERARFRDGVWLDRRQGALWSYDMIASARVESAPALRRIVVAVDPAVTSNEDSDETGIVVAGISSDDHIFILGDFSLTGTPLAWGREAIDLYRRYGADRIIGEVNQGGDLIESNLRSIDKSVPYKQVRATRGKTLRAEPVAALYEQGKVHHVGIMTELETQMTDYNPESTYSPDRLDALVWACTELTSGRGPIIPPVLVTGGGVMNDYKY